MAPEQELAQTRAKANLLVALYAHVTHDLEQLLRERDSLRSELDQARGEATHMRAEVQRLNNELGQSDARATELQHSTSWRVTAPLRALGRLLKRRS